MGGLFNRSLVQGDETKIKVRKQKQKRRYQQLDITFEPELFFIQDGNENEDPNVDFINKYDLWDKEFDQQQIMNTNVDPHDVSSAYSSNYSVPQNDIMSQSWQSSHGANNSFYPINSLQMIPSYNMPYDPNQHVQAQVSNTINNQSQTVMLDEQLSKKVQFSSSSHHQEQQTSALKPLINTQSWHESNVATIDTSVPITTKPAPLSNRPFVSRSVAVVPNTSSAQKAIYVGIDHKATLAERGQTVANKRHRRNGKRNHSNASNSSTKNHRTHSRTNHQNKHRKPTDSPSSNNNITPNESVDFGQQKISTSKHKINKFEQIPLVNNEIKPSKSRENHRQHRRHHQQRLPTLPLNNESSTRRIKNKHSNTPMIRIPLSQFNQ